LYIEINSNIFLYTYSSTVKSPPIKPQLTEDQQKQTRLIAELAKAKENLENSKEKLKIVQVSQPQATEELQNVSNTMQEVRKIEQKIANNFVVIQQNILEKKCLSCYFSTMTIAFPPTCHIPTTT
jgi:predicted nuclease with TOPRIM domain